MPDHGTVSQVARPGEHPRAVVVSLVTRLRAWAVEPLDRAICAPGAAAMTTPPGAMGDAGSLPPSGPARVRACPLGPGVRLLRQGRGRAPQP